MIWFWCRRRFFIGRRDHVAVGIPRAGPRRASSRSWRCGADRRYWCPFDRSIWPRFRGRRIRSWSSENRLGSRRLIAVAQIVVDRGGLAAHGGDFACSVWDAVLADRAESGPVGNVAGAELLRRLASGAGRPAPRRPGVRRGSDDLDAGGLGIGDERRRAPVSVSTWFAIALITPRRRGGGRHRAPILADSLMLVWRADRGRARTWVSKPVIVVDFHGCPRSRSEAVEY